MCASSRSLTNTGRIIVSVLASVQHLLIEGEERQGQVRGGGEVVGSIRRTLSLAGIRAQSHSFVGRLEGLGRGVTAAMGRWNEALQLERVWLRERKATALSLRNGFNILRRGFAQLD